MQLESSVFGGEFQPDGSLSPVFTARIVIPPCEFARLGLGAHESPNRLPACFEWCHANLGIGGTNWLVTLRDDAGAQIYFAKASDATAFLTRWANDALPAQRVALARSTERRAAGSVRRADAQRAMVAGV